MLIVKESVFFSLKTLGAFGLRQGAKEESQVIEMSKTLTESQH